MDSEFPFQGSQKLLFASAVVGALNIDFWLILLGQYIELEVYGPYGPDF